MVWRFSGLSGSGPWRSAKSLITVALQVNQAWPDRSTSTDGTIASSQHTVANPNSDHEPWVDDGFVDVVTAVDITHDPANGADMGVMCEAIRLSQDPRVKYVIHNRSMFSSYPRGQYPPFVWRPYSGTNPHTSHVHISVLPDKGLYDDETEWSIQGDDMTPEQEAAVDWLIELRDTLQDEFGWSDGENSAKRLEYANRLRNGLAARTDKGGDNGSAIANALALLSDVSAGQNGVSRAEYEAHTHGTP